MTVRDPLTLTLLRRARDHADANYATSDVAALAGVARMSRAHFSRRFAAAYGVSPHRYLLRRRIERARALIAMGHPVTVAADAVGFGSLGTFSTRFSQMVGCAPREYARRASAPTGVPGCAVRTMALPPRWARSGTNEEAVPGRRS